MSKIIKNNNTSNDFTKNYQKAINNYTNTIKFYHDNYQIIDCIFKIINSYKESILDFKKKLIQIKINLIQPFYDEEQKIFKYKGEIHSFSDQFLIKISQILSAQINSISNIIEDSDKNIFVEIKENNNNNKNNNNFLNNAIQNKTNLISQQKKLEKMIIDYNKEHKKFIDEFRSIEEDVQKFYVNTRKKKKDPKMKDINKLLNEANKIQNIFLKTHNKFIENNKNYFNFYEEKMNEIKKEIIKNGNYIENNINLFLLSLKSNTTSFLNILNNAKEKDEIKEENNKKIKEEEITIKSNYELFYKKYVEQLETIYEKEKYKIKAIHSRIFNDYLTTESRQMIKALKEEFDIDDFVDPSVIILKEEDIFYTVKFFYSFDFVDKAEYDLNLEEKNIEVINLTNKLLQPELIKTKYEENKGLLPINDEEIKLLKDYIGKNIKYRENFINVINNFRVYGKFELAERNYELIGDYFLNIIDCIFKEKNEQDYSILNTTIILSQTFYINSNGKKIYLMNKIKGHKLFYESEFFIKYLQYEIKKFEDKAKTTSKLTQLSTKDFEQIIYSQILSFHNCMNSLDMPKDIINQIIIEIFKENKVSENMQKTINSIIGAI